MSANSKSIDELLASLDGLFQKDPKEFEHQRQLLIQATIEAFPEHFKNKAYGMQFKLDSDLSRYKDPVMRMNRMVELFWEQFELLQEVIHSPGQVLERRKNRAPAKVIQFPARQAKDE